MSYQAHQQGSGNASQRPFSFQIPPDNSAGHAQHPQEQSRPPPTMHAEQSSQGWSGYPEQRFSYLETPIDDNTQTFDDERQAALLQEARARYGDGQQAQSTPVQQEGSSQHQGLPAGAAEYPPEKQQVNRMPSAYQLAPPAEPHPAQFAPYAESTQPMHPAYPAAAATHPSQQYQVLPDQRHASPPPPPHSPGPLPLKTENDFPQPRPETVPPQHPSQLATSPQFAPPPTKIASPAPFSPYTGNAVDLNTQHRPGQIAHPSMSNTKTGTGQQAPASNHHFRHSLCACPGSDISTCLLGLTCPCILYSRLTFRLGQKNRNHDPTDVLGFHKCNGHCIGFAALCTCGVSGILAAVTRGRIRHAYDIDGSVGSDCIEGCCCCCCTVIQSEREVRIREQEKTRWTAPSAAVDLEPYKRVESMRYSSATGA